MASLIVVLVLLLFVITISRLPAVGPLFPRDTGHGFPGGGRRSLLLPGTSAAGRRTLLLRGMPRTAGLGRKGKTSQLPAGPTFRVAGTLPGILLVLVLLLTAASATSGAALIGVMDRVVVVVLVQDERIQPGHVALDVQGGTLVRLMKLLLAG